VDDIPLAATLLQPGCAMLWRLAAAQDAEAHWYHVAECHALDDGRFAAMAEAKAWEDRVRTAAQILAVMEAHGLVGAA